MHCIGVLKAGLEQVSVCVFVLWRQHSSVCFVHNPWGPHRCVHTQSLQLKASYRFLSLRRISFVAGEKWAAPWTSHQPSTGLTHLQTGHSQTHTHTFTLLGLHVFGRKPELTTEREDTPTRVGTSVMPWAEHTPPFRLCMRHSNYPPKWISHN